MSIWNKILIGLIFVASVAFFYMAARTLKTHQYWRSVAQGYDYLIGVQDEFGENCKEGGDLAIVENSGGTPVMVTAGSYTLFIAALAGFSDAGSSLSLTTYEGS